MNFTPTQSLYTSSTIMFVAFVIEIFLYSFCGEQIMEHASKMSNALYSSKWYNICAIPQRRAILLALTMSQQPMGLRASSFYFLTLEIFTQVCKIAFNLCAFIVSIME